MGDLSDKSSVNLDGPTGSRTSNLARLKERFNKKNWHLVGWKSRKFFSSGYSNNLLWGSLNQLHWPCKYRNLIRHRDVLLILLVSWSYCRNNSVKESTVACNGRGAVIVSIKALGRKEVKISAHICLILRSIIHNKIHRTILSLSQRKAYIQNNMLPTFGKSMEIFPSNVFSDKWANIYWHVNNLKFRSARWEIKDNGVKQMTIISVHSV